MFKLLEGIDICIVFHGEFRKTSVFLREGSLYARYLDTFVLLRPDGSTSGSPVRWDGEQLTVIKGKVVPADAALRLELGLTAPDTDQSTLGSYPMLTRVALFSIAGYLVWNLL